MTGSLLDSQKPIFIRTNCQFTGTGLQKFPVAAEKPLDLATELDRLAQERQKHLPGQLAEDFPLSRTVLDEHKDKAGFLEFHHHFELLTCAPYRVLRNRYRLGIFCARTGSKGPQEADVFGCLWGR